MDTKLELLERIIQAAAVVSHRPAEDLWEMWHLAARFSGYDFDKTLVEFLGTLYGMLP